MKKSRGILLISGVGLLLVGAPSTAGVGHAWEHAVPTQTVTPGTRPAPSVSITGYRMSARIDGVPLRDALAAVARAAPLKVTISGPADEPVSLNVTDVDMERGIRQLLRGQSYVLVHAPLRPAPGQAATRLVGFLVISDAGAHGTGGADAPDHAAARRPSARPARPGRPEEIVKTRVSGRAADELSHAALWAPFPDERVAALKALSRRAGGAPGVAPVLEALATALSDPEESVRAVALDLLAPYAGPAVPVEALARLAREDRNPSLRRQAVARLAGQTREDARAAVRLALSDPDPAVRELAQAAVTGIR